MKIERKMKIMFISMTDFGLNVNHKDHWMMTIVFFLQKTNHISYIIGSDFIFRCFIKYGLEMRYRCFWFLYTGKGDVR